MGNAGVMLSMGTISSLNTYLKNNQFNDFDNDADAYVYRCIKRADGCIDNLYSTYKPLCCKDFKSVMDKLTDTEASMVLKYIRRGHFDFRYPENRKYPKTRRELLQTIKEFHDIQCGRLSFSYGRNNRSKGLLRCDYRNNLTRYSLSNKDIIYMLSD